MLAFGLGIELAQPRVIVGGGVDGGKLGREALDGALRVHDLADRDAGEIELHGERLGEQPRIALRDPRAAAGADLDVDDALRLQRAQRIARDDPADAEALRPGPFRCRGNRPGRSSLANSASRTCATIWVDIVAVRNGITFRPSPFIAGCSRI